ncbi:hypothetical protein [Mycobacterium sp. pR1184]|uniref:hypothetical protein n=1 Tax=Mycobacterium sp. pR1184 TaxID=3238981 RepID=UPI00351BA32C
MNVLKKPFEGARLPTWVREAPEYYALVAFALSPLAGLWIFESHGWAKLGWAAAAVGAFVVGWGLLWARSIGTRSKGAWMAKAKAEHQAEIDRLVTGHNETVQTLVQGQNETVENLVRSRAEAIERLQRDNQETVEKLVREHREALETILHEDLYTVLIVVAEALSHPDPQVRKTKAILARKTVVCAAAKMVGKATAKTRANLFVLAPDKKSMSLEDDMWFGRHERSVRVFSEGSDIFQKTMNNQVKFLNKVSDEIIAAEHLVYRTYLTHPVLIGVNNIYGVLTVDSLHEGDLDPVVDVPIAAVLSALIALTYAAERPQGPTKFEV